MGKNKKSKGINSFLKSEKGQRFFNFAYSIGAAIVIWGALFKILHLPGGSTLLCIGMGTEIAMFVLTAFERPAKEYKWEEVFPALDKERRQRMEEEGLLPGEMHPGGGYGYAGGGGYAGAIGTTGSYSGDGDVEGEYDENGEYTGGDHGGYGGGGYAGGGGGGYVGGGYVGPIGGGYAPDGTYQGEEGEIPEGSEGGAVVRGGTVVAGGTVVVGGNYPSAEGAMQQAGLPSGIQLSEDDTTSLRESIRKMSAAADQLSQMAELTSATQDYLSRISGIAEQMTMLQETTAELNRVSGVLLDSYKAITDNSSTISESSNGYVESMADLNRNIGGLNTIYEIQLKSISSQLESIDRVNRGLKDIRDMYEKSARQSSRYCEETEKMARYMKQLNSVYEKMITAMTINMYNPMMGGQQRPADGYNPFEENRESEEDNNSINS